MIQESRKVKTKWHKPSGREVEPIMAYGQVVRCRVVETGKVTSFHPASLVDSYAETKPAKVAVWREKMMVSSERITESCKCSCGGKKSSGSARCFKCRFPNPGNKTAAKICQCGKPMHHRSSMCQECCGLATRDETGQFVNRRGEAVHGLPQPTTDEALLLADPPEDREHEADAIIARYSAMIRAARIESGALHRDGDACEPLGKLALAIGGGIFNTPGSDRRRGRV